MPKTRSHNYALLIGVGECKYSDWSLPVTVKDIEALKSILIAPELCAYPEQNLRLLHDQQATFEGILDGLNWLKEHAASNSESTILVYYSGHGWLDTSTDKYYLIPHDVKPHKISNSALSAEDFHKALQQIKAQRFLVIIDSCHAQGMASAKEAKIELPDNCIQTSLPQNLLKNLNQGEGRVAFTSSKGNQLSWISSDNQMSIFTYHLLEALQGAGNQPGDEVVKVSNLMNYLGQTVPESARKEHQAEQVPFFDFATEDFPVALLRGGKGLPPEGWETVKSEAEEKINSLSRVEIISNTSGGLSINVGGNARDFKFGDLSGKDAKGEN